MARKSRKVDYVNVGNKENLVTEAENQCEKVSHAALYARLSYESEKNRERNTIETQMVLLHNFVKEQKDIVVAKEYYDISKTGTNFERDGFNEMMQDIKEGNIDCVIVKDLSRLGRNYVEAGSYIERVFPFFNVRFISVNDHYDSFRDDISLLISMSNVYNEFYSRDLAKKIRSSYRTSWANGEFPSGQMAYGYEKDKANEKAFTNQKRVLTKRGVACPIFFCPTCGRRLGFTSRETGYRCMQAHISGLSGCAESKMDRKEAEETVLDAARNMAQLISENLEKKKSEWHKTILKEENIATLESEKKRLSSRKMKLYSDYRSEVLDKEGYMEELEKTTSRISEITLQIAELENEIAVAKKKCDEATEKEMEVNEIAALQDFDKIQLSKIIEKVFIYEPGRMEISWKMDDIFYKEEKA